LLNTFKNVDALLDHKDASNPAAKTLREALNINRLLVKRDVTTSLDLVMN